MPRKETSAKSANSDREIQKELDKNIKTNAALEAKQILAMNGRNKWQHIEKETEQVYDSMAHTPECLHETCCHIIETGNLTLEKNEVTFASYQICNSHGLDKPNNSNVNYEQSSHGIQENLDAKEVRSVVTGNNTRSQDQESPKSNNSPHQELSENNDPSYDNSSLDENVHHNCKTIIAGQENRDFSIRSSECHGTSSVKRETYHSLANLSSDSDIRQDSDYQKECLLNNNNNEQKTNDGRKTNSNEPLEPLGYTENNDRREQISLTKNTKWSRKRTLSSDEIHSPRRYGRQINEHQSCTIRSTKNTNLSAALKTGIVTDKESTNTSRNDAHVDTQADTQIDIQVDIKVNSQADGEASQPGENSSACKLHIQGSLRDDDTSKEVVSRDNERIDAIGITINVTSDEAETSVDNLQSNSRIKAITVEDDIKQVKSIKEINSNTENNTKQYSSTTAGNIKENNSTRSNNLKDNSVSKDLIYVDCAKEATSKTVVSRKDTDQIQYSSAIAESAAIVIYQNNKDVASAGSAEGKQYQTISTECANLIEKEHAVVHGSDEVVLIKTDNVENTNVPACDSISEE